MPKPSWKDPKKKDVFVTNQPTASVKRVDESFTVYSTWESSELWWCGWKNYTKLWSALRFGMANGYNKRQISYVKNNQTNEIVWRSWEDENPYRDR